MTTPLAGIGATAGTVPTDSQVTSASAKTASTGMGLDPQAFLQLLVAQLKYQDPSSPMDTSTFMNQTATLSQVQTMNAMATTLNSLSGAQQAQAATDLIGKQVTYLDSSGNRATGLVSSAALLSSGATLQVGSTSVPLSGVLEVSAPKST